MKKVKQNPAVEDLWLDRKVVAGAQSIVLVMEVFPPDAEQLYGGEVTTREWDVVKQEVKPTSSLARHPLPHFQRDYRFLGKKFVIKPGSTILKRRKEGSSSPYVVVLSLEHLISGSRMQYQAWDPKINRVPDRGQTNRFPLSEKLHREFEYYGELSG
ncbi:MAG: hypothetical protein JWN37_810 [Candidatus Nomurabacteria bacterium]|nr:hypothetical protein [Candidatus Nomurabacteria bacterium]